MEDGPAGSNNKIFIKLNRKIVIMYVIQAVMASSIPSLAG